EHRCRGHLYVIVGVHAVLHYGSRTRFVCLQIPVSFVKSLPDPAEVGLAVYGARRRGCALRGQRYPHGDYGSHSRRGNRHDNQRGDETVLHDRSPLSSIQRITVLAAIGKSCGKASTSGAAQCGRIRASAARESTLLSARAQEQCRHAKISLVAAGLFIDAIRLVALLV